MNFLEGLNPQQLRAVYSPAETLSIIAGPGTGKTRTLIARIVHLIIEKHVPPSQILAVTFTKKAAAEMKDRLVQAVGPKQAGSVWIGTFHAVCTRLLQKRGTPIRLVSEEKRLQYLKSAIEQIGWKGSLRDASTAITRIKNSLSSDQQELLTAYNQRLASEKVGDYDDLLVAAHALLQESESIRADMQKELQYLFVDEFQDTSPVQYEIIRTLCTNSDTAKFLTVIGDPYQSIYAFRGSSAHIFSRLKSDFQECEEIHLHLNYRSDADIVAISSRLFPQIKLESTHTASGTAQVIQCLNEYAEADLIVSRIGGLVGGTDLLHASQVAHQPHPCRFSDCAVIYRSHRLRYPLVSAFLRSGMPFQVVGDDSPFYKTAIRCIIDCLRFIYIKDGQTRSKLEQYAFIKPLDIENYLIAMDADGAKVLELIHDIEQLFALSQVFKDDKEYTVDLNQFRQSLFRFDLQKNGLKDALSYIQFLEEHEFYDPRADRVSLLTMHAAKGLEFKHVMICGFEDGIIPHTYNNQRADEEEEKRLLYVALTRAQESLTLLYTRSRDKKTSHISRFYERIACPALQLYEDENTVRIRKRIEKNKIKKSQMKLF